MDPFELFSANKSGAFEEGVTFSWRVNPQYTVAEVRIYANSQLIIAQPMPAGGWPYPGPLLFTSIWDTRGFPASVPVITVYYFDGVLNPPNPPNYILVQDAVPPGTIKICPPALRINDLYPPQNAYSFPQDELFPSQWNLHNVGQQAGPRDQDIDMPQAWAIETGDSSVIVAVCGGLLREVSTSLRSDPRSRRQPRQVSEIPSSSGADKGSVSTLHSGVERRSPPRTLPASPR